MLTKRYEQLTFADDFMFCKVLQSEPELCRELLELILDKEIGELVTVNKQYPIEITSDKRGVRFDVYAKDDKSVVYDVEMQNALRDSLPKRARYIQSLMDLDLLERGARFSELSKSYVIFICRFNIKPEEGMHRYTFRNLCVEKKDIELEDETEKILLCTEGTEADLSPEMEDFLKYVSGSLPESDFSKRLDEAVIKSRLHPGWRKEYMDLQEYIDIERANTEREKARAEAEKARAEAEKARADAAEAEAAKLRAELEALKKRL